MPCSPRSWAVRVTSGRGWCPSLLSGGTGPAPVGDSGGAVADAELGVDPPDVILHGFLRQEQAGGDLAVGLPVRDERHHLDLARGQPGIFTPARSRNVVVVHVTSGRTARRKRERVSQLADPAPVHPVAQMGRLGTT